MQITVDNVLRISEPTDAVRRWIREELTVANPDYAKKQRMGLWTGNTPKTISLYAVDGDALILPYGCLRRVVELAPTAYVTVNIPNAVRVNYHCDVPLYDYQRTAVAEMQRAGFGILQSPAGSGKTQMGIALAAAIGKRTLWLTHTVDLVNQSMRRAAQYMDPDLLGTITGGKINVGRGITFATVQTACRIDLRQYADTWDCVIVDECHRVAGSPTQLTQFSTVLNALRARHKYGLSATVHRSDGLIKATFSLLGNVSYAVPEEAVADKIMQVAVCPVATGIGASRACLNPDGTIQHAKLINYLCENEERNRFLLDLIKSERGQSCLILSDRLQHLQALAEAIPPDMREQSCFLSGETKKDERERALDEMRSGEKKYLFATYALAKEGLDIPRLDRLFLATPQKDYAVITQSLGRIARTFPGKDYALAYDLVDDGIEYCVRFYQKRKTIYRKNNCAFAPRLENRE